MRKHILCYGDSNTFGTDPVHGGRHPDDARWTGVLQKILGDGYQVIEEGCGGRTTVFEDELSYGRNGLKTLIPCIASHNPLDLIIVMLGTNDLKKRFGATPWDLGKAMEQLIDEILRFPFEPVYPKPQILVVSPVLVKEGISKSPYGCFTEEAVSLSRCFAAEYESVSKAKKCWFFDAAAAAEASDEDRLHMTAENHAKLGAGLAGKVLEILG
ncbi:G-D-S-L family lipolytic protein [Clostridiaceae bacterium]|nr:G-D-S-L family lipolytic protein [Clostridiaceae bacterium]RKI18385.1 G-D-S-L family lipolytic protein [bacterium 1XD21-70]